MIKKIIIIELLKTKSQNIQKEIQNYQHPQNCDEILDPYSEVGDLENVNDT